MCGLWGIINLSGVKPKVNSPGKKIAAEFLDGLFEDLGILNMFRGRDATGVFWAQVEKGKYKPYYYKKAVQAIDFFDDKDALRSVSYAIRNSPFLVGHTRAGTCKVHGDEAAHPFEHKHIIGVHNGVVPIHGIPGNTADDYTNAKVDSDVLYRAIADVGWRETLTRIRGDFSLIWFDSNEQLLYFARNAKRPLHFAHLDEDDNDILVFSSEEGMLRYALRRNGFRYKLPWTYKVENNDIVVAKFDLVTPTTNPVTEVVKEGPIYQRPFGGTTYPLKRDGSGSGSSITNLFGKSTSEGTGGVTTTTASSAKTSLAAGSGRRNWPFQIGDRVDVDVFCWRPRKDRNPYGKGDLLVVTYPMDKGIGVRDVRIIIPKIKLEDFLMGEKLEQAKKSVEYCNAANFLGIKKTVVITSNGRQDNPKQFHMLEVNNYFTAQFTGKGSTRYDWTADMHAPPKIEKPATLERNATCGVCKTVIPDTVHSDNVMAVCDLCAEKMYI